MVQYLLIKMRFFMILLIFALLSGCAQFDDTPITSTPNFGSEIAHKPDWQVGDFWVIKQIKTINDKTDVQFYVYTVKNKTFLSATIPYTAKEDDLNLKALYLRQSKTFQELQNSTPEGDNLISESVYVLERFEPIKLEPRYTGCPKPTFYQLDFESEKLTKEFAYATYDLRLVWDPDIPGRQLKYFHWPLQTGKYWSYPIINMGSVEGQKFVDEKIAKAKDDGFDIAPHEVFSRAIISDYLTDFSDISSDISSDTSSDISSDTSSDTFSNNFSNNFSSNYFNNSYSNSFIIEISHLYPFFANYDRNELTIIYNNKSKFWTENYHSDLAGIAINQTQEIVFYGTNFSEDIFQNLTSMINFTVINQNSSCDENFSQNI